MIHAAANSRLRVIRSAMSSAEWARLTAMLGFIAVVASTTNVVSGYLITDRMLKMFKKRGGEGRGTDKK